MKVLLALVAAVLVLAKTSSAQDAPCCALPPEIQVNYTKAYAKLNLSVEQKAKLDAAELECEVAAGNKESRKQFMASAQSVLSREQFTQLEAECARLFQALPKS
ncbi:MAG: hypothetical protein M3Q46_00125 [Verrucomicrobiota bacterium]|nr:hypothetical protein [Verrucomicrobiota bacterium]